MKKIILNLPKISQKAYPIFIGPSLMEKIPTLLDIGKFSKTFIITDQNTKPLFLKKLIASLPLESVSIVLPNGEKAKNIESIKKIWAALLKRQYDRKSLVINLGGGVIGDIGGFAASTFMRGVDFLNIPTTLLAQVDASVGGKTGIDFAGIKNLIGTFNQPIAVVCDINLLSTLPNREFISGFAEIIKHGLIADKNYFNFVISKKPGDFNNKELTTIVLNSIRIKASIVNKDEKESGLRKILNFGHTIGHAIESLSQETATPLLHGEAISIGMVAEGQISKLLGLLSNQEYKIIEQSLAKSGLPTKLDLPADDILEKIKSDKKNIKGETKFTLLGGIGKAIINKSVDEAIIRQVL